ncbi:MAG: hypothetical protein HY960_04615 [Ignavibacteriae bacterium]|nr:hypothetical protein [Ignavibacteriota bacterium]
MSQKVKSVHKESIISGLLLVSVLVLFVSAFSFSQDEIFSSGGTARNIALGGGPINPFLDDAMRVHINPAQFIEYKDFIWGDVGFRTTDGSSGSGSTQYLGANITLSENFNTAIIFNKRESPLYTSDYSNAWFDPTSEMNRKTFRVGLSDFGRPLNPVELALAYRFEKFDLGASLSIGGWSRSADDIAKVTEQSSRTTRLKIGGNMEVRDNVVADAVFLFGFNSMKGTYSSFYQTTTLETDGGTEYGFDIRVRYELDDKLTLIPIGRLYSFTWEPKITTTEVSNPVETSEWSNSTWEMGIGFNYSKNRLLLVGGATMQIQSLSTNNKMSSISRVEKMSDLPKISFGMEWKFTDWFIGRMGYFNRFTSTRIEQTATNTSTTTSTTEQPWYGDPNGFSAGQQRITLGLGFRFWDFAIDGTISEGMIIKGPWFISGETQSLFSLLSLHYQL